MPAHSIIFFFPKKKNHYFARMFRSCVSYCLTGRLLMEQILALKYWVSLTAHYFRMARRYVKVHWYSGCWMRAWKNFFAMKRNLNYVKKGSL